MHKGGDALAWTTPEVSEFRFPGFGFRISGFRFRWGGGGTGLDDALRLGEGASSTHPQPLADDFAIHTVAFAGYFDQKSGGNVGL